MSDCTTYPEMNDKIVAILRVSDEPHCLYAAQRIEELEKMLAAERERAERYYDVIYAVLMGSHRLPKYIINAFLKVVDEHEDYCD